MNDIVELVVLELLCESLLVAEVQFYEVDSFVVEVCPRAGRPHSRPCLHALAESLLDDETADETACSCYQNSFHYKKSRFSLAKVQNNSLLLSYLQQKQLKSYGNK